MSDQDGLTPIELAKLREIIAVNDAQNAVVQMASTIPPHGKLIGRIGRFAVGLVNYTAGALTILLLRSDLEQATKEWTPTVCAAGESLVCFLDDHADRNAAENRGYANLIAPQFPEPFDSGDIVVTPGTAVVHLRTHPATVVVGPATTTTTPAPPRSSSGFSLIADTGKFELNGGNPASLAGTAVLTLTGRGTLS